MNKQVRLSEANKVLVAISQHGRRFFFDKKSGRIAKFELTIDGKLWFRDDYTDQRIYTAYRGRWRKFSHGGTMRRLIDDLAAFIRTDKPIPASHFGPWPEWYCEGDLWGYGQEAMQALRRELNVIPSLKGRMVKS